MNEDIAGALEALFESNFQQTARIEALEITVSALISTLASLHPMLSNQLPEMLEALANTRAAQLSESESTAAAFNRLLKYLPSGPRPQPLGRFSSIPIH